MTCNCLQSLLGGTRRPDRSSTLLRSVAASLLLGSPVTVVDDDLLEDDLLDDDLVLTLNHFSGYGSAAIVTVGANSSGSNGFSNGNLVAVCVRVFTA